MPSDSDFPAADETRAKKREEARLRRAKEKEEEDKRLIAAGAGTRHAKAIANAKTGNADGGRDLKRASSPTQVAERLKKLQKTRHGGDESDSEPEDQLFDAEEPKVQKPPPKTTRSSTKTSRSHPPAVISESDDEQPAAKIKPRQGKAKPKPATKKKAAKARPRVVADASESSASAIESSGNPSEEEEQDNKEEEEEGEGDSEIDMAREASFLLPSRPGNLRGRSASLDAAMSYGNAPEYAAEVESDEPVFARRHRSTSTTASMASYSSGPGAGVPETEYDDESEYAYTSGHVSMADDDDEEEQLQPDDEEEPWQGVNYEEAPLAEEEIPSSAPAKMHTKQPAEFDDISQPTVDLRQLVAATAPKKSKRKAEKKTTPGVDDDAAAPKVASRMKRKSGPLPTEQEIDPKRQKRDKDSARNVIPVERADKNAQGDRDALERRVSGGKPKQRNDIEKRPKGKSSWEQKADQEASLETSARPPKPKKRSAESTPVKQHPEEYYDVSTRIVFPPPTKDMKLTDQSVELRAVLSGAIELIKRDGLFKDAYPVIKSRPGVAKMAMLKVARALPEASHIVARLEGDPRMAKWLCNIPMDRLSTLRSSAKAQARVIAPGDYQFAHLNAASTKIAVENLVRDHTYIFPVNAITGLPEDDQPFRHPAIIKLIKDEWFTPSFITRYAKYFLSSRPKHPDEVEMPETILALGANAMYGALSEYLMTGERQAIKFTENAYEDSYRSHLATLKKARATAPTTTARLLHTIYKEVTSSTTPGSTIAATMIVVYCFWSLDLRLVRGYNLMEMVCLQRERYEQSSVLTPERLARIHLEKQVLSVLVTPGFYAETVDVLGLTIAPTMKLEYWLKPLMPTVDPDTVCVRMAEMGVPIELVEDAFAFAQNYLDDERRGRLPVGWTEAELTAFQHKKDERPVPGSLNDEALVLLPQSPVTGLERGSGEYGPILDV
ncbi:hypothetical protein C8F04DRAFT_1274057 [Mycena alexandri]|uniref:DUF6532 domain-containing protein n=1 Tax=Mycena alexandri TaxID=1745969 RepID=A0AAD6S5Y0_9AGAR|nr:hypothetical protein C8F04DRAFT_1274057 [Mycena alexandri]